jgi:hypothetical protein
LRGSDSVELPKKNLRVNVQPRSDKRVTGEVATDQGKKLEGFSEVLHANKIFTSQAFPHVDIGLPPPTPYSDPGGIFPLL